MTDSAYDQLLAATDQIALLDATASLLSWDQETMMPPQAAGSRAREIAWLSQCVHEKATDDAIAGWLDAAENDDAVMGDAVEAANAREIRRQYERSRKVPSDLVAKISEASSKALEAWKGARERSDWNAFAPHLETLVGLLREKATALGVPADGELWDALADGYEPGARGADIDACFKGLRESLVPLIADAAERTRKIDFSNVRHRKVPIEAQQKLNAFVARRMLEGLGVR